MAYKRRLKTLLDVRRYLAHIIIEGEHGNIDINVVSKLAYCVNILRRCITDSDLEQRLKELEKEVFK